MLIPLILLVAVACARPIGPMPPIPDASAEMNMLNPFESPLQTPDTPNSASPFVDDVDDNIDIGIDTSFPPSIPESSQFPVIPFINPSPSPSPSPSASLSPAISAEPSQTSNMPHVSVSTTPPPLVTPSSTPVIFQNSPSPAPIIPTSSPSQSKSPNIRQTTTPDTTTPEKGVQVTITPDETSKNRLRGEENRATTIPSTKPISITPQISPQISPRTTTKLSTPLPNNNARANDTAASMEPLPSTLAPDGFPPPSPLPPPIMSQRTTCFPASATVTLMDGSIVRMRHLSIGDFVHVGSFTYSKVHMFTHREYDTLQQFVRLTTESGPVLTVSEGHYVYVGTVLKPARDISVGDYLPLGNGGFTRVRSIDTVIERGLYNPQTGTGDIVVNGIKASVYTEAVKPTLAHAALLPLRVAFSVFGVTTQCADHGFPESVPRNLRSLVSAR